MIRTLILKDCKTRGYEVDNIVNQVTRFLDSCDPDNRVDITLEVLESWNEDGTPR